MLAQIDNLELDLKKKQGFLDETLGKIERDRAALKALTDAVSAAQTAVHDADLALQVIEAKLRILQGIQEKLRANHVKMLVSKAQQEAPCMDKE